MNFVTFNFPNPKTSIYVRGTEIAFVDMDGNVTISDGATFDDVKDALRYAFEYIFKEMK